MLRDVRVKITGGEALEAALRRLTPNENPALAEAYFRDAGALLVARIRSYLDGPRPQELDLVTGELYRSIEAESALRFVEAGTDLPWLELYELGIGRFRQRAAVLPALEGSIEDLEVLLARRWEGAA